MTFFDWVDFFMNPYNIFMFGLAAGILTWFLSAGFLYTLGVERTKGMRIAKYMTILTMTFTWVLFWGLYFWYNTPMGSSLELNFRE